MNEFLAAAPFLRLGSLAFVRQEVLERRKQEGAEFSALAICFCERVLFLEMNTESLDEIFSVVFPVTAPADVGVKRVPVDLKKVSQRFVRSRGILGIPAGENHAPTGGVEAASAAASFLAGLHASRVTNRCSCYKQLPENAETGAREGPLRPDSCGRARRCRAAAAVPTRLDSVSPYRERQL